MMIMIQSMTGYGKAEAMLPAGRLTVEIRSVNGKSADISIKTSLLPKERELEVRKRLADRLQRGSIDLFLTWEPNSTESARQINSALALDYVRQIEKIAGGCGCPDISLDKTAMAGILSSVLRMPDVLDSDRREVIDEESWPAVSEALDNAIETILQYRYREGEALYTDVTGRVGKILEIYDEVEALEPERVATVRERLEKAISELCLKPDKERFEQEMIFYLEKYDINEEKVRLRQHCKYFLDTIDSDPNPGKKLGFIIQEMGREINTTGPKANHAGIQKCVVRMKDELEKIREQCMNIL